ncbi:TRAP transporter small permease subunit [Desulfopila aestuarii]|uniref:TRAP-type mannitol/chloroaromatic compound transport system, small permease component n=1 Tax=Desulfopila aestuarii DSM 18488 TaxID=1121416 RepID=A0A1M7XVH1_9BACT|nr:TRAP transporter small permease subunit [Desulfopila aestuarii]SHO42604.1 TRAP-type mannitol/chloroaromatic compound transport system, small permease component [Desulfopila aestuarii DSM 18488]
MLSKIAKGIDTFSTKQGEFTSMLIIPLLGVVLYEVLMRYGFNSPTIWGFEMTGFLYGMHYMFGISYTDVRGGHVRVDIFTALAPKKVQAAIGALTTLVLFMPVMICMTVASGKYAWTSIQALERNSTSWQPPIYPIKMVMALCFFFLLLQGFSNLIKDLQILFSKEER